ncbi:phage antirepressor KilAC domain-containing protein [Bifidobacterium eulemuris]|uniref:Phage anti-repressor protein n=1 Tax=Bifidobacterium eulemuris TaxID=1765219 RepID=A0A261G9X4_9BIFI|nr:phage antirepressor KilAC domain-containing protein [Bifidobacterium eulemuris]OZG68208.1 phage anti-repressor protein [Bifidobacterium eulemuris]QOL31735.1 phage antirepressor KilAC domain-containing protein [Bifidobacterium eulemuris]
MSSELTLTFEGVDITALEVDTDEPLFVAGPIAKKLGYESAKDMLRNLDADEKGRHIVPTLGGPQEASVITLPGLNHALNNRRSGAIKDEATRNMVVRFQRWVNHEVLPSIQRHGAYATPATIENVLNDPEFGIRLLTALKEERDENRTLTARNRELEPKAALGDVFLSTDGTLSITEAARHFRTLDKDMTRDKVYGLLQGSGYIVMKGRAPTVKAIEPGYLVQRQFVRRDGRKCAPYARFTPKGIDWFIRRFIYGTSQGELDVAA